MPIAADALIPWNGFLSATPIGLEANFPSTTITLTAAGVYRIDYRIIVGSVAPAPSTPPSIELVLDGTAVPNSALVLAENLEISGVAVVTTTAENTSVALRATGNSINLAPGTSAFLDIIKIA